MLIPSAPPSTAEDVIRRSLVLAVVVTCESCQQRPASEIVAFGAEVFMVCLPCAEVTEDTVVIDDRP